MSRRESKTPEPSPSRWPHRLAWVLACATFPLIWMGGLVTTYKAGMAVPDWPTTFGHWFYPVQKWLWSFSDLFLEHGHRTIAQGVGLLSIALVVVVWRLDGRKWMRLVACAVLAGVILQGVLGGLRVILEEQLLAKFHGCTAPLVFGLCTAVVTLTSTGWRRDEEPKPHTAAQRIQWIAITLLAAIYALIFLGVQLRHPLPSTDPGSFEAWGIFKVLSFGLVTTWFQLWVALKLLLAAVVVAGLVWLMIVVFRKAREEKILVRRAVLLGALFATQLVLAAATWVTNYGWPAWFSEYFWAVQYTVVEEGPLQVWVTTGHTAFGSLNLAAALSLVLWSRRLLQPARAANSPAKT